MAGMKLLRKPSGHWVAFCTLLLAGLLFNGCQTGPQYADPLAEVPDLPLPAAVKSSPAPAATSSTPTNGAPSGRLRVGDSLTITYSDAPNPIVPYEGRIKDDGTITIPPYNQEFTAAGKNVRELEQEIRTRYVPKFYLNLTVSVKSQDLVYTVNGEVRTPNRYVLAGQMTALGAIATAGGFTDYAKKTKVQITRADGKKLTVNCVKAVAHPELDLPIYSGDKINVPRRLF
jgi:polysaccharide export outer membrane protein